MNEIKKIIELKKIIDSLQPIKEDLRKKIEKKFRLEFNYNSNHIEGNTLTYSETELLLVFDDTKGEHTLREYEEMKGSDVAYQLVIDWANDKERTLSEQQIKNLNEILLVRPFWKDAITPDGQNTRRLIKVGDYKEFPNSVRLANGEIFEYANPIDTPILMAELIDWYKKEESKQEMHPYVLAALLHYKFVRIHPFDDGNGRISRLLLNYVLIKNDYPPVIIKSEDKKNYLSALNKADTGDLDAFVEYIGSQLLWSLEILIKGAKGESIDEPGDLDKKINLLKQKFKTDKKSVTVYKSTEAILNILDNSLKPFFKSLSSKLSEFDILFKSKDEGFILGGSWLSRDLQTSINALKNLLPKQNIGVFMYRVQFQNFRNENHQFSVDFNFQVLLHQNVYEITDEKGKELLSKLYNENLTNEEIQNLVEVFGTKVLELIER